MTGPDREAIGSIWAAAGSKNLCLCVVGALCLNVTAPFGTRYLALRQTHRQNWAESFLAHHSALSEADKMVKSASLPGTEREDIVAWPFLQ